MSILLVQQSAPYGNSSAKEALDIALSAATFEQDISILFTGDACYQLMANQNSEKIDQKNISQMLKALPIYGIEEMYVDEDCLRKRQITHLTDSSSIKKLSKTDIKKMYQSADTVIRL